MRALRRKQEEVSFLRPDEIRNNMVQMRELVDIVRAAFPRPVQPDDQRILLARFEIVRSVKPKVERSVFVRSPAVTEEPCCETMEP